MSYFKNNATIETKVTVKVGGQRFLSAQNLARNVAWGPVMRLSLKYNWRKRFPSWNDYETHVEKKTKKYVRRSLPIFEKIFNQEV